MNVPQPHSTDVPDSREVPEAPEPPEASKPSEAPSPSKAPAPSKASENGPAVAGGSRGPSAAILMWLAVLLVFAGGMTLWGAWQLFQREARDVAVVAVESDSAGGDAAALPTKPPGSDQNWIDEFTLTERSGRTFDSRELEGKVWVASFFFATCPSYCVQQNQHVKALHDEYADQDVVFVSITCDPKNDTPEKLREYARRFNAGPESWLFLTGDLNYIRRIGAEKFLQPVHEQTHKNSLVVVDKWGEMRGSFDWNDEKEMKELREMIETLQTETEPPEKAS